MTPNMPIEGTKRKCKNRTATPRRSPTATLLDFLFPPACLICRTAVTTHGVLCPACWSDIDFITPPICDRLGTPLPFDPGEPIVSAAATAAPPRYNRARVSAAFKGNMRTLIHDLKYRDKHDGVALFGRWLTISGKDLLKDADLLIPVPLYWTRLWTRRFNQAAELAKEVSNLTGIPYQPLALRRIKRTKTQIGMTLPQRKKNVSGAFKVTTSKRREIAEQNVILIDDVITTGATIEAATNALLRAGAARIDILALAMVIDKPTHKI